MHDTSQTEEVDEFTSLGAELRRLHFTGTIWFATAVVAGAIQLAATVASGWRPGELPAAASFVWWAGTVLAVLGTVGFAWAGCPVLGFTMEEADWQKSKSMRWGTLFYITGTVLAWFAVLIAS
jgi:hypothetical protein